MLRLPYGLLSLKTYGTGGSFGPVSPLQPREHLLLDTFRMAGNLIIVLSTALPGGRHTGVGKRGSAVPLACPCWPNRSSAVIGTGGCFCSIRQSRLSINSPTIFGSLPSAPFKQGTMRHGCKGYDTLPGSRGAYMYLAYTVGSSFVSPPVCRVFHAVGSGVGSVIHLL